MITIILILIFLFVDEPKVSGWERAMRALNRVSEVYKAKHDKPMVIVYDNISQLVHKNPEILDILQDDAKDNADNRKYIAVFVSSEGSVPRRMECKYDVIFFVLLKIVLLTKRDSYFSP